MQANRFMSGAVSARMEDAIQTKSERSEVAIESHAFGDFGGALSWPIPLDMSERNEVLKAIQLFRKSLKEEWRPGRQLLECLNAEHALTVEETGDPAQALQTLVASARGQALGLQVQTHLRGIATDQSVNDYALAALQLDLDPLSIDRRQRNTVAGLDLAGKPFWGKPLVAVFEELRRHLLKYLICSPELSGLAAYALLAFNAPLYLIKKIPEEVTYGGQAWFNLAVAAAIVEVHAPGKVACMTFAQVMLHAEQAALIDPAVSAYAQTLALIDWGVVHGLVPRASDERYTDVQLDELKTRFNDQLADGLNAPILLGRVLPDRKAIALAGLKKQFGENFPVENHALEWDSSEKTLLSLSPVSSPTYGPLGMYSLLDVAMMDTSYHWKTSDPLLKFRIHEINELNLRVWETFSRQFASTLADLKQGTRLTLQHLIAGLPLEDRENFEYGKIDFYQHKIFRLSTQFWGRNLIATDTRLTLRIERGPEKKVTVYSIDLEAGSITRKESDPAGKADEYDRHVPSLVYATIPFHVADETVAAKLKQVIFDAEMPVPASYDSARTRTIVDAFVEHLDYDREDILLAAKGQTTYDKEVALLKSRLDFLLNLIPFKSAIENFVQGKYIDGAIDLFLDVLGFVTAGAGAAAKLTQVAARTTSAISKALKAAKIIGVLVIGELNPLSGLHLAATGGVRLVGGGIKFIADRSLLKLTRLRGGVVGSYELLQTVGKQHGTALVGTWKTGGQSVEGVGVVKSDQWYRYNPATDQVYGAPGDFQPRQGRLGSLFGADANYVDRYSSFNDNIEAACTPLNLAAFKRGYSNGLDVLDTIADYRFSLNTLELIELAAKPGRRPDEMGALAREIKDSLFDDAKYYSDLLIQDMPKGVKVTPLAQHYFLARVDLASNGKCAALSYAMAYAFHHGRESTLLRNVFKAANKQTDLQAARFISGLETSQQRLGGKYSFHTGGKPQKMDAQNIIDELASAREQKILMIGTKSHGMVAGTRFSDGGQQWFFYDPNSGMAIFNSRETLQEGLSKALRDGALAKTFHKYGKKRGGADYAVNEFKPDASEIADIRGTLEGFSAAPLSV
jgi:hypothetical protein